MLPSFPVAFVIEMATVLFQLGRWLVYPICVWLVSLFGLERPAPLFFIKCSPNRKYATLIRKMAHPVNNLVQ